MIQIINLVFETITYYLVAGVVFATLLSILTYALRDKALTITEIVVSILVWVFILTKIIGLYNGDSEEDTSKQ